MITSSFKQIYGIKIIGTAGSLNSNSSPTLAFDVQGTRTRWRIIRTTEDFQQLATHFKNTSKIPSLPVKSTPSTLGKWLTSVFWLFKGRRGSSTETTDTNLIEFLKFLHPSQSDTATTTQNNNSNVNNRHTTHNENDIVSETDSLGRTTTTSDSLSETDSLGRTTTTSDSLSTASDLFSSSSNGQNRDATSNPLESTSTFDDTLSSSLDGSEDESFLSISTNSSRNYMPPSSAPNPSNTPNSSRRDSLDVTIAQLVPRVVQQQMDKMKRDTNEMTKQLEGERRRHLHDRRSEQLLLQERYEKLMKAAEKDRMTLEQRLDEINNENVRLRSALITATEKERVAHEASMQLKKESGNPSQDRQRRESMGNSNMEMLRSQRDTLQVQLLQMESHNSKLILELENAFNTLKINHEEKDGRSNDAVRHSREMKSVNEARAREVTLREVAENAVFEAESEVERHRVLYRRERKARMKMQRRLTFYRQLEERLKEVAPGNMKDRLSFLFEEKKSSSIKSSKHSNQSILQSNLQSSQQSSQHSSSSPSRRRARSRSGSSNNYRDEYYPDSAPSINFNIRNSNDAQSSSTPLGTFMNGSKKGTTMQSLRTMSVSELRYFLNLRNIPHRDCIEKIELLFRAQTALEKEEKQEKQDKQERKEFNSEMKGEKMDDENESSNDMGSNDGSNGSNDSSGEGDLGGVERRDRVESERASWETSSEEEEDEYKKEEKEQKQETTKDQKKEEAEEEKEKEEEKENEDEDEDGLVFRLSRRTKKKTTNINDNNDINNADLNFFKTKINNTTTNQNGSSSSTTTTTTTTTTTSSSTASASDRRKKQSVLRAKRRAAASKKSSSSRRSRNHRSTRTQSSSNTTAPTTTNTNTTNTASSITTTSIPTSPNDDPPLVGIHTLPSPEKYTTTTTTNNQYLPSPSPPPPPPSFNSTDVTNQRIEERRLREELDAQQREIKAVQKLRSSEQQKQQEANEITSVQGRLRSEVQQWAINKSLIRMLCTLDKIMGTDITLPTLKLRLSSTSSDVKTAYKQALRCVHPDKLRSATTNDRVRGEYVFNALREAYTRSNENGGMFGPTPVWAKRW